MHQAKIPTAKKIFTVIIHEKEYDVYDIDGKEHEGLNGEPKSWWVYFSDRLPEGLTPPIDSDVWEPYSKGINRRLWDIRFKEYNTSKEKWGSTQFSNRLRCEMWCNNKIVYAFGTFDLSFAFAKAQYLITMMSEHPYDFFEPQNNEGRKIYFYGLPATIKVRSDSWEIGIVPDYSAGVSKETWWKEFQIRRNPVLRTDKSDEDDDMIWGEQDPRSWINWGDALSDGNIKWFRN